jgi:predicted transcriptional regulator of viral defense system
VSSKKVHTVRTSKGTFLYKQIKPELMFGFTVTRFENITYKIATIEKSFLDYLYLNPDIDNLKIVNDLRIDIEYFLEQINKEQFKNYLERFSNKALSIRARKLLGGEYA